jgi:hypothetical protein
MALGEVKTDVHTTVELVEGSKEFQEFNAQNPHHYLVHAFSATGTPLELGYYGKEADRIVVFKTNPIVAMPPEEIFKEEGKVLHALDLTAVRFGLKEALDRAEKQRQQVYPRHECMRTIAILQQADRPVWNITLVTNTLNMINMKIDAMTGELVSRDMQNIMSIVKDQK